MTTTWLFCLALGLFFSDAFLIGRQKRALTCSQSWNLYGGSCYSVQNARVTYTEAQQQCALLGGYVTRIQDGPEFKFVKDLGIKLLETADSPYWLGGKNVSGVWTWDDGTRISYASWAGNEPDYLQGTCLMVGSSQLWKAIDCLKPRRFICEKSADYVPDPTTASPVVTTTTTSVPVTAAVTTGVPVTDAPLPEAVPVTTQNVPVTEVFTTAPEVFTTAPEVFTAAPEVFTTAPEVFTTAPEVFTTAPEVFTTAPEVFTTAPEVFTAAPEVFTTAPEVFTAAPEVFTTAPEVFTATPEVFTAAPEVFTAAPEVFTTAPEVLTAAPEVFTVAPEVFTTAPEVFTTAPEVFTTAPEVFTTAPEVFTTAPEVFTTAPEVFTTAPEVFTTAPEVFTAAPEVFTTAPEVFTAAPEVFTAAPEVFTTAPEVFTTAPEVFTTAPEVFTTAPEVFTTAPEVFTTAPEVFTTAPEVFTTAPEVFTTTAEVTKKPVITFQRTWIFLEKRTYLGQNVFFRGGVDHARRQGCTGDANTSACAIPIKYPEINMPEGHVAAFKAWSRGDSHLDWYGSEAGQGSFNGKSAGGTPAVWTTNDKNSAGYHPLNSFGPNYWLLEVDMDCTKTDNHLFEVKGYLDGVWEGYIAGNQCAATKDAPFASSNHIAVCGLINIFHWNEARCDIGVVAG